MSVLPLKGNYATDVRPARDGGERKLWAKDPTDPAADNGTRLDATFVNDLIGLVRALFAAAGTSPNAGDDSALSAAVVALADQRAAIILHDDRYYTQSEIDAAIAPLAGKLDKAGGTMTGALVLSGDGTNPLHAVTKQQLDTVLYGLDGKASCRVKTTANVDLAGGGLAAGTTHDDVELAEGDRVLVGSQTAPAENGIYVVPASGAASRAPDMDAWANIPGAFVVVEEGTASADTAYICVANQGGTLDTTSITWAQATSPTAGVTSFNGRNGTVSPEADDYEIADITGLVAALAGKEAADADILKRDATAQLVKGFNATSFDAGTKSSGMFTPDPTERNFQHATNNGAHTLAAPATPCSIVIEYTNGASAGAITPSGFDIVVGENPTSDTTKYQACILKSNSIASLTWVVPS